MRILWIGTRVNMPREASAMRTAAQVPSLLALATEPDFDAVLLDCREDCPWSLPHILSAAAELKALCLLAGPELRERLRGKLPVAGTPEAALELLRASQNRGRLQALAEFAPKTRKRPPLSLPQGAVIDVVGSQARIGVTTQCFQLWHHFTARGCRAAVVLPAAQLRELAQLLEHIPIRDGIEVEGIPLVTIPSRRYDCCIRDRGCLPGEGMDGDLCVLVAGCKPWELMHTARALERLRSLPRLAVILSFCGAEARPLLAQMGYTGCVISAPWQPEPLSAAGTELYNELSDILRR